MNTYIKNSEERLLDYKKQLEEVHKNRASFLCDDEELIWYKTILHELKNDESKYLKRLVTERYYENQGLCIASCYPY